MADYHPLLTRALDALSDRSPAMRRAVYDRARAALMDQLRSLDPPLSEADIARERLALEDAVNRVEAEQKRREAAPVEPLMPAAGSPVVREPARRPPQPIPARGDDASLLEEPAPAANEPEEFAQAPQAPPPRGRPRIDTVPPQVAGGGRGRTVILAAALAVVIGLIAAAAYILRDKPADLPRQPVVAEAPPAPPADNKIG
jgi:hypothetical protein